MEATSMVQIAAGVVCVVILAILILRRRARSN